MCDFSMSGTSRIASPSGLLGGYGCRNVLKEKNAPGITVGHWILIMFINCNWVVTRWQWLFYMYTNMKKKVTRKFNSGGLNERHVVTTLKLGNHLSIRL